jgi:hypothetical protein
LRSRSETGDLGSRNETGDLGSRSETSDLESRYDPAGNGICVTDRRTFAVEGPADPFTKPDIGEVML